MRGGDVAIAVTGTDTDPAVNGVPFGINAGLRTYLAVRGGIDVTPVLGSRSYDVMSAIGPQPLQPGDVLPVGEHTNDFPELDQASVAAFSEDLIELHVVPGTRDDWLTEPDALIHTGWVASDRSDRVGMRLVGTPRQHRWPDRQLPSEGVTGGAIQVPAERAAGDFGPRPSGHGRIPRRGGGDRRRHRPPGADTSGPAHPSALVEATPTVVDPHMCEPRSTRPA